MSDRLINLFMKEVKRANDGLMPADLQVKVSMAGGVLEGALMKCDDGAGVMIIESPLASKKLRSFVRYEAIESITIKT